MDAFSFDPAGEFYRVSISCCESERGLLGKVTREVIEKYIFLKKYNAPLYHLTGQIY